MMQTFSKPQINAGSAGFVAFICGVDCQRIALTNSYTSLLLLFRQAGFYYTNQQEK